MSVAEPLILQVPARPNREFVRFSPAAIAEMVGGYPPTSEQTEIIQAPMRPGVVIAGAGSGKTETMAARVVWLVANRLVSPERILGLTFTRKAAGELQQRIRARLRTFYRADNQVAEPIGEPTVLTYAAYAGRLVDEHAMLIGREPGARLLTEAARWQLADSVVRRYDGSFEVEPGVVSTVTERTLDLAGQLADHLAEADEVRALTTKIRNQLDPLPKGQRTRKEWPEYVDKLRSSLMKRTDLLPLIERFDEAKRRVGAIDFPDQMVLATELASLPAVAAIEASRYDLILLDEYQDTGHAQIEMLCALFAEGQAVTAVGDPLQSIYGWRGASAANIGQFERRFQSGDGQAVQRFGLLTSWRNDRRILSAANRIAEPLRNPGDGPLTERPNAGIGRVAISFQPSVVEEAIWIAETLKREWLQREHPDWTDGQRTLAVLVRKRSGIATIAQSIREAGLPVEVVDLGGLLTLPEISDIRAVLQVLADHNAGGSLGRLLTGARWRIGPADLVALHERARMLAGQTSRSLQSSDARSSDDPLSLIPDDPDRSDGAYGASHDDDERVDPSLIEALDDLGDERSYSAEGFRRLADCGTVIRRLRRRLELPLPDLISEVECALGLDVEVAARSEASEAVLGDPGRANVDRFIDEAARFVGERSGGDRVAGLSAFLGYLKAAEDEEYGLKPAATEVQAERVQILTVHGSKGLEWDVVCVAGLIEKGFPDQAKSHDWASTPALLPTPLRGDRNHMPELTFLGCADRSDAEERVKQHRAELTARHLLEERRLAYVAFTRARKALYVSGAAWGSGSTVRVPSVFLEELRGLAEGGTVEVDRWHVVSEGETNPLQAADHAVLWPADPLSPARRVALESAAELVRQSMARQAVSPSSRSLPSSMPAIARRASADLSIAESWQRDVDLLLAEHRAAGGPGEVVVAMPDQLSVTEVVELAQNPEALARRLRRPLPHRPAKQARRGNAFHRWLEQRWAAETLLDIDELPGAVDEQIDDLELEEFKARFETSAWADQTPIAVEVPFEMSFDGRVVRGRMDAVFREPTGRFVIVDWKTGSPPVGAEARAKATQLALYRLAWAELQGIGDSDLALVSAAFHYVGADVTVAPADLLTASQLRTLLNG
ncbi:ATP-dependent helicase [Jatrophihabitans sp. DSM 45814]